MKFSNSPDDFGALRAAYREEFAQDSEYFERTVSMAYKALSETMISEKNMLLFLMKDHGTRLSTNRFAQEVMHDNRDATSDEMNALILTSHLVGLQTAENSKEALLQTRENILSHSDNPRIVQQMYERFADYYPDLKRDLQSELTSKSISVQSTED